MKIKLFLDGASLDAMATAPPTVAGFTTNPSLVRKLKATDYGSFCRDALQAAGGRPVSLEVIADDPQGMIDQALTIAGWGPNAVVKIPVFNSRGESTKPVLEVLRRERIPLNLTAVLDVSQLWPVRDLLNAPDWPVIVSVFAGRIADTGRDPALAVKQVLGYLWNHRNVRVLWASTRQVYDVVAADNLGCHVITVSPELLAKTALFGKDLQAYSAETAKQFHDDAVASGFTIATPPGCAIIKV